MGGMHVGVGSGGECTGSMPGWRQSWRFAGWLDGRFGQPDDGAIDGLWRRLAIERESLGVCSVAEPGNCAANGDAGLSEEDGRSGPAGGEFGATAILGCSAATTEGPAVGLARELAGKSDRQSTRGK